MRHVPFLSVTLVSICAAAILFDAKAEEKNKEQSITMAPKEEIAALMDWGVRAEALHKTVAALHNVASVGGEVENETLARYQMLIANARLAFAQGRIQESERLYATAVQTAELCEGATEAAYNAGTVGLDRYVVAQQNVAYARVALSRIRNPIDK